MWTGDVPSARAPIPAVVAAGVVAGASRAAATSAPVTGAASGRALAGTTPTFTRTLAGPAAANMYSSGAEWDATNGRIVVADTGNNQIEFYSPTTGARSGRFGAFGSGNGQLNSPRHVAVDGSANIYVADAGNNRVQKFTASGTFLATWGESGTGDGQFTARYSDKGLAELNFPAGRASPRAAKKEVIPAKIRAWHRTTETALKKFLAGKK